MFNTKPITTRWQKYIYIEGRASPTTREHAGKAGCYTEPCPVPNLHIHIYVYIYTHMQASTHTRIYIYIYIP